MKLYFVALKKFRGLFSPKWAGEYIPLLLTPLTNAYGALFIVGAESVMEEDTYYCPRIVSFPISEIESRVRKELEYNKEQKKTEWVLIESLECSAKKVGTEFIITPKKVGKYVGSPLRLEFDPDQSTPNFKVYKLSGDINVNIEESDLRTMKMTLSRKMAFYKSLKSLRGR